MTVTSWIAIAVAKSTALLLGAVCASLALHRRSAAARHLIWGLAFATLMFLPFAELMRPWAPAGLVLPVTAALGRSLQKIPTGVDYSLLLSLLYMAGVGVCWLRTGWGVLCASRLSKRSLPLEYDPMIAIEVRQTNAPIAPAVWGSRLLVPEEFAHWPQSRKDAIVIHETAHIERFDTWTALAASFVSGLYWFQPLVWFALRRLRIEQEKACDDAVLRAGIPASRYAEDLLAVAASLRPMLGVPGATAVLPMRLRSLLSGDRSRAPLGRRAVGLAVVIAMLAFVPIATVRTAMAADEQAYRVGPGITSPILIQKVEPQYTQEAREAKTEGAVVLAIQIGADGKVQNAAITRGLDPGLDRNALIAINQWLFEPGKKDGKPVLIAATVEINFRLK